MNVAIFLNATRQAIHLGNDHDVNLRNVKNFSRRTTGQLFWEIEKLISLGRNKFSGIQKPNTPAN